MNYTEEPWEQAERESHEAIARVAEAWVQKWPNHCKHCGGWGGFVFYESRGMPGPGEQMMDPCGAIEWSYICHRCGEAGLSSDGDGPCSKCGWDYDDGLPSP